MARASLFASFLSAGIAVTVASCMTATTTGDDGDAAGGDAVVGQLGDDVPPPGDGAGPGEDGGGTAGDSSGGGDQFTPAGDSNSGDHDDPTGDSGSGDHDTPAGDSSGGGPTLPNPPPGELGHCDAAQWKHDRAGVLCVTFDDSTPGQARHGVPAMIAHGITGTWFINPGTGHYQDYVDVWQTVAPQGGQELANHSMHHAGAADYATAEAEIGDVAAIIWSVYPPGRSKLMAFNSGGGTDWNVTPEEYAALLIAYQQIERKYSFGIATGSTGLDPLDGDGIFGLIKAKLQGANPWFENWGTIHFHGICDKITDTDNPRCICTPGEYCQEYGYSQVLSAAIELAEFNELLDNLTTDTYFVDSIWLTGFVSAYKYQQLRNNSEFGIVSVDSTAIVMRLSMGPGLDPLVYSTNGDEPLEALFDEELTVQTTVPATWGSCIATQGGATLPCSYANGTAQYEIRWGAGDVTVTEN